MRIVWQNMVVLALLLVGLNQAHAAPILHNGGNGSATGGVKGADPQFIFSFTSNDGTTTAFGTLNATANGDGTFTAISGTGTEASAGYTGGISLIANPSPPGSTSSPSGFFTYDDQLLPGQNPLITNGGLLFSPTGSAAFTELNIFSNGPGPGTYTLYDNTGFNLNGNFSLSQVVVPEPASLTLLGLGVTGLAFYALRKRRTRPASS
jgi:hypothetical protein